MFSRPYTYYTEELRKSEAELKVLNEQGARALSRYDIEIAHQGDAAQALRTAKRLVGNHIAYVTAKIAALAQHKLGQRRLCWLIQKCAATRSCIHPWEVRGANCTPLERLTSMTLEIDRHELTNRVNASFTLVGN